MHRVLVAVLSFAVRGIRRVYVLVGTRHFNATRSPLYDFDHVMVIVLNV